MFNQIYATPKLVKFGKSKDLIQGDCGWGVENITVDKTGYQEYLQKNCLERSTCNFEVVCMPSEPYDTCANHSNC
ncbi:hypothetical protein J2T13_002129 [Paenibacillus sp. DS2015]|uniref:hypothetical protein n=1 Tax=Paenibacillus sp. DS2015 TaxID=3373917 RepID=UPI003D24813C